MLINQQNHQKREISDKTSTHPLMEPTAFMRAITLLLSFTLIGVVVTGELQETFAPRSPIISRTRLSAEQYESLSNKLLGKGYRLNYLSGYTIANEPHFAGIWEPPRLPVNPPQIVEIGMNSSAYQRHFDDSVSKGYRLAVVNGYTVNNSDQYLAIWNSSPSPPWISRHGMTAAELQIVFTGLVALGYRGTHLCGYGIHGEAYYAAILEKRNGPPRAAWAGMTGRMFQERIDVLRAHGYDLIDINGYGVQGLDLYAAVWEYRDGMAGEWVERHGMEHEEYELEQAKHSEAGYTLKILSGYTLNESDVYAALWVKP
jgi:hypothetical protein